MLAKIFGCTEINMGFLKSIMTTINQEPLKLRLNEFNNENKTNKNEPSGSQNLFINVSSVQKSILSGTPKRILDVSDYLPRQKQNKNIIATAIKTWDSFCKGPSAEDWSPYESQELSKTKK